MPYTESFRRINFFHGFQTSSDDWTKAQEYDLEKRKLHNASLHRPGVVGDSLGVEVTDRGALLVHPGYAVDGEGRDLFRPQPWKGTVDLTKYSLPTVLYVTMSYREEFESQRTNASNKDLVGYAFVREDPYLEIAQAEPDNHSTLELARLRIPADATRLDRSHVDMTSVPRAGAVTHVRFEDLAEHVRQGAADVPADGQGQVNIDTVPASSRQRVYLVSAYPEDSGGEEEISWRLRVRRFGDQISYFLEFRNHAKKPVTVTYSVHRA